MSDVRELTLDDLRNAVRGGAAAFRSITRLQPAGGPGDKVFPPTYAVSERATTKYALETRRIDGKDVPCVLLDSVASQANRMEEALLEGWRAGELHFPVITVDFSDEEGLRDLGEITSLDAPHRVADALLRDSVSDDGLPFRATDLGRSFTNATPKHATPMYRICPTALIFGIWDSTGPLGGLGAKFQRALVSEIVGVGVATGVKTASRLDPTGIQSGVSVYHSKSDRSDWTAESEEAEHDKKGKPLPFSRTKADGKGKPSAINHGNIAPSIDTLAGGVTFEYAEQVTVLSLPALRRLRFNTDVDGRPLKGNGRGDATQAARTALAALGIAAIVYQRDEGYDLRSRSLLVPEGPFILELVSGDGDEPQRFTLSRDGAETLLSAAHESAITHGFGWERVPMTLKPAPKLAALIRASRQLAGDGSGDEE